MKRISLHIIILLFSIILVGSNTPAQVCGNGFVQVTVSDISGEAISDATIEIIAAFPKRSVDPAFYKSEENPPWMKYVEPTGGASFWTIRPKKIKKILKLTLSPDRVKDYCGNPLKQQLGVTPVKITSGSLTGYRGETNFGYCTSELHSTLYILKVSAPGYLDSYFLSNFLGHCDRSVNFVLSARNRRKTKKLS